MRYRLMATYRGVPYEAGLGPTDADVVLFAACPPPEDLGFEPATGHWRKPVGRAEVALWESRPTGMFRGEPCLVLDDLGDRLHIAYVGDDPYQAARLGYHQVEPAVFEVVTNREAVTELTEERVPHPFQLWQAAASWRSAEEPPPAERPRLPAAPLPPAGPAVLLPRSQPAPAAPSTGAPASPTGAATSPARPATSPTGPAVPVIQAGEAADPAAADPLADLALPVSPARLAPDPGLAAPPASSALPVSSAGPAAEPALVVPSADPALPVSPAGPAAELVPAGPAVPVSVSAPPPAVSVPRPGLPPEPVPAGPAPVRAEPGPELVPAVPLAGAAVPVSRTEPPASEPARNRRGRSAGRPPRAETRWIFSELASLAAIPPAAYAIDEEVDGATCLIRTEHGFEVFTASGGARHEVRLFQDEEAAYFYLFGLLTAEAVRDGRLVPPR